MLPDTSPQSTQPEVCGHQAEAPNSGVQAQGSSLEPAPSAESNAFQNQQNADTTQGSAGESTSSTESTSLERNESEGTGQHTSSTQVAGVGPGDDPFRRMQGHQAEDPNSGVQAQESSPGSAPSVESNALQNQQTADATQGSAGASTSSTESTSLESNESEGSGQHTSSTQVAGVGPGDDPFRRSSGLSVAVLLALSTGALCNIVALIALQQGSFPSRQNSASITSLNVGGQSCKAFAQAYSLSESLLCGCTSDRHCARNKHPCWDENSEALVFYVYNYNAGCETTYQVCRNPYGYKGIRPDFEFGLVKLEEVASRCNQTVTPGASNTHTQVKLMAVKDVGMFIESPEQRRCLLYADIRDYNSSSCPAVNALHELRLSWLQSTLRFRYIGADSTRQHYYVFDAPPNKTVDAILVNNLSPQNLDVSRSRASYLNIIQGENLSAETNGSLVTKLPMLLVVRIFTIVLFVSCFLTRWQPTYILLLVVILVVWGLQVLLDIIAVDWSSGAWRVWEDVSACLIVSWILTSLLTLILYVMLVLKISKPSARTATNQTTANHNEGTANANDESTANANGESTANTNTDNRGSQSANMNRLDRVAAFTADFWRGRDLSCGCENSCQSANCFSGRRSDESA